ncbi:MAG: PAS domain-containing protein [Actinomycetota bacterium]
MCETLSTPEERPPLPPQGEAERRRFLEVFEQAPAFMCILRGPSHVFEIANAAYLQLVGHREIIGKTAREALPELSGQGYFKLLDRVYQTGEPFVGRQMPVLITSSPAGSTEEAFLDFVYQPLRDPDGAVSGILVHGIDVTARVSAERELAHRVAEAERWRRLYETALSNTVDFNYVFDLEGRFVFVNQALLSLWQRDLAYAVGKSFLELDYPPELAARLQEEIQQVIATKQPLKNQTPYTGVAGGGYYEYIFVPVFGTGGAVEAVAGSTRDITERMELEQHLRRMAADLSEADHRKDEFLATLAHELRNPLAPLRTGLEVLQVAGNAGESAERTRTMMARQLDQMTRLVDDLLDVSRITRNRLELRKANIELAEVVRDALETSRPLLEACGHSLTVTLPPQPIHLKADQVRLAQVFSNLLNNAAKYTERGGQVWFTVVLHGNQVEVSVRDNGVGIGPSLLPKVFNLFTQADHSLERSQGGLGIGLTLVKRLVEMHDGTVEARSGGLGQGSEFIVRLPVAVAPSAEAESPTALTAPSLNQRRKILVVDDNRDGAESLGELLELLGNEVELAYDGEAGVAAAASFSPTVILLDIGLPRLNGYEACRRIREQPGGDRIVIVALTGWGQEEDRRRAAEAGFDLHLVKPVDPATLKKLLSGL